MTRVLLLAQGDGRRWETGGVPFLGRPKQLVEIDGEALVHRSARQFTERGCDVIVVGPDARFLNGHGRLVTLEDPWPVPTDMSKFFATRHLWSESERTVIAWGDVWHSEEAVDLIAGHHDDALHYFRRPGRSTVTGHRWDESFAVSFGPAEHRRVIAVAEEVQQAWSSGNLRRRKGTHLPIRVHYAAAIGAPLDKTAALTSTPGQTVIDDWSDDFDSPEDYRNWVARRESVHPRVAVCIPWFGGDDYRTNAWSCVRSRYEAMGLTVYVGDDDTGGEWTNRARGCNNAVADALADDPEVLLIGDADTVVPPEQVWAAAHAARMTGQLVIGYTEYVKLGPRATQRYRAGLTDRTGRDRIKWHKHVSGAVFVTPDLFAQVGGFDERFNSWGGEDRAFWAACMTLAGGWHRIPGTVHHLWHPPSPERKGSHPNRAKVRELGRRYKLASGWLTGGGTLPAIADHDTDPDLAAMKALLTEPGGPLAGRLTDG